jgi:hypothetical protein
METEMAHSFSLNRSHVSVLSGPALREEIQAHTGNEEETSSIIRSLGRFGEDGSIRFYEMTPMPTRRAYHASSASSWTVRAVR